MTENGLASSTRSGIPDLSTPAKIVEAATRLYEEKYQADYEGEHKGEYAAIDVRGRGIYVDESSSGALEKARKEAPNGVFHLIRIGYDSAFKATRFVARQDDWFRSPA